MRRRNADVHHGIVANRFEVEREERAALTFTSGQIATSSFNVAGENQVKSMGVVYDGVT